MTSERAPLNPIFAGLPTTIFETMSRLARETGAINLGQGFPDGPGPAEVRAKAAEAVIDGDNQYPPMAGLPALREAVAAHYRRFQGLDLDWPSEVTITSGATEALTAAILALVSPGDEVVLFEPIYDSYLPMVRLAGGVPRLVRLEPPHWRFDPAALAASFGPRTRVVVLNTPLNPAGSCLGADDLALLAELCVRHDCVAITDEVWEHVVFEPTRHLPLMALPGMRARTVKIGSAGKIFALTGWKVGFAMAAPALTAVIAKAHQFLTFTTPPNLQTAVAFGLGLPDAYFEAMRADLRRSRDRLVAALRAEGYAVTPSQGTYFITIDLKASGIALDDRDFCERAVREAGVVTIPLSAFYDGTPETGHVRLCFAKRDATLDAAAERLGRARRLFA